MTNTRKQIKAIAKARISKQRYTAILTQVFVILAGIPFLLFVYRQHIPFVPDDGYVFLIVVLVFEILIAVPVYVNSYGIDIKIFHQERASIKDIFLNFHKNYFNKIAGMVLRWLLISLCFIFVALTVFIPHFRSIVFILIGGIISIVVGTFVSITLSMVPFILADCPNVSAKKALSISQRMTDGYELELFILGLSFFWWYLPMSIIIAVIPDLLLGFLLSLIYLAVFLIPYRATTYAGYYSELWASAINSGTVSASEFQQG